MVEMATALRRAADAVEQLAVGGPAGEQLWAEVAGNRQIRKSCRWLARNLGVSIGQSVPDLKRFRVTALPIVAEGRTLLALDRLYTLWQAARNTASLQLPALEVGVYRGGSAQFLAGALAAHTTYPVELHAVDTFAGHPAASISEHDSPDHQPGNFDAVSEAEVSAYLDRGGRIRLHVGAAETTLPQLSKLSFGLAHLDVDLYRPTITALDFLGERLVPGGIVVLDDYGGRKCPGVAQAASEFLEHRRDFQIWYPPTEQAVLIRVS